MSNDQKHLPGWCNRTLQGLVYWIGHRCALYNGHHLTEGALVAEACNLIYANLHDNQDLRCEVQYSQLLPHKLPDCLRHNSVADLVIVEAATGTKTKEPGGLFAKVSAVIEVKRANAGKKLIEDDIERLTALKGASKHFNPDLRTFLLLVSEAKLPRRFVRGDGTAVRGNLKVANPRIPGSYFRVKRVCKAAHSFRRKELAHFACIIEVFNG